MGARVIDCSRDKQPCTFESATRRSARALALWVGGWLLRLARNSSELRTIRSASPDNSSSSEASSKQSWVVTGWVILYTRQQGSDVKVAR